MNRRQRRKQQFAQTRADERTAEQELADLKIAYARGRVDGWQNAATGMGTGRDKLTGTSFVWGPRLSYVELEALYYQSDLAATIIDTLPDHALRDGYNFEKYSNAAALKKQLEDLEADECILEGMTWARLYGGAAIVVGADDRLDPQYPLAPERVRSVKFLNVIDRRFLFPVSFYSDPLAARYGQPEVFEVTSPLGGGSSYVHETRLIRFLGTKVDKITQRREAGWSYSAMQRVYDVLQKFETGSNATAQLLVDAGQGVFKIDGLLQAIASDEEYSMQSRMAAVDLARWAGRSLLLDAESEDFERKPVALSGASDLFDRLMLRLAAAARMPVTLLFGRSPAGLNATGESDLKQWEKSVKTTQRKTVRPVLHRLCTLMTAGKFDAEIEFNAIVDSDPKADADVDKVKAETWKTYVDMGALHPEQVAMAEFADEPIEIDVVAYKKALKAEVELTVSTAGQPPPPPPVPGQPPNAAAAEDPSAAEDDTADEEA